VIWQIFKMLAYLKQRRLIVALRKRLQHKLVLNAKFWGMVFFNKKRPRAII